MTTVTLKVEGMTCGHCKASVEKAVAGVGAEAQVDLASKQVTVQYDAATTNEQAIRTAIEDQGYDVA
ncbi:cation transporter [Paenibacillus sp. 481]|uniref:cation transporter n=1 Tax=Paenibacillus sp. 481 TaxID=2835869 RepID=UPI001E2FD23A|nr:cation transporter [Paenibacillus sp. 481]UHA73853.1 heavy-metal-associated domain-containing protein [Paenibacillus sp. 481]